MFYNNKNFDNYDENETLNTTLGNEIEKWKKNNENYGGAGVLANENLYQSTSTSTGTLISSSISSSGDVIFEGSTPNNSFAWNSVSNTLSVSGNLSMTGPSTFTGDSTFNGTVTATDIIITNSFKLGNNKQEFSILEADPTTDNIIIQNTISDKDLLFRINIGGTNRDMLVLDGSNNFIVGSGFEVACDINATTFDLDASGAITIDSTASSIALNSATTTNIQAAGNVTIDSSGGTIGIGTDASNKVDINALAIELDAGSSILLDSVATIALNSGTTTNIQAAGNVTIDSSGGTIGIGTDASNKVDINALEIELDSAGTIKLNSATTTDIEAVGNVTIDSTTAGISLDAVTACNFTTADVLTLDGTGGVNINSNNNPGQINIGSLGERTITVGDESIPSTTTLNINAKILKYNNSATQSLNTGDSILINAIYIRVESATDVTGITLGDGTDNQIIYIINIGDKDITFKAPSGGSKLYNSDIYSKLKKRTCMKCIWIADHWYPIISPIS